MKITFLNVFLCITLSCQSTNGADFFESVNTRLICYPEEQEGCNTELTDALPEYSWSVTNLTEAKTHVYLFTKKNVDVPELLHKCGGDVPENTNFNPLCRTEIFIPGFVSGVCNYAIYRELKNERLKCGCYNVILIDWMWGNIFDLKVAKLNFVIVAKQIAFVIRNLKNRFGLSAGHFILTGHSYGAHIAGMVGQEETVGIIHGLDPAGVLFTEYTPKDERLDADDAACVHVMHCNAGQCLPGYFGVNFTCGTIDFWYNGGLYQPSCFRQIPISFLKGDYVYGTLSLYPAACHHFQCLQYYKASMCRPYCPFLGIKSERVGDTHQMKYKDCGVDGKHCAVSGAYACDCYSGNGVGKNYYVNTGLCCPFCDNSRINKNGYSCRQAHI